MRAAFVPGLLLGMLAAYPCPSPAAISLPWLRLPCLFQYFTHLPCPLCGLTRSLVCAAHLQMESAIAFHPLGIVLFGFLVAWFIAALTKRKLALPPVTERVLVGLFLLVWAFRLLHWLPFPPA